MSGFCLVGIAGNTHRPSNSRVLVDTILEALRLVGRIVTKIHDILDAGVPLPICPGGLLKNPGFGWVSMMHFGPEPEMCAMRGRFRDQGGLFSYISAEARVPLKQPLRQIENRFGRS